MTDEEIKALTLRIRAELHERLRRLAFERRTTITDLVTGFTEEGLAKIDAEEAGQ